jgi:hypothetical protein
MLVKWDQGASRRTALHLVVVAILVCLTGCASVPLSSLLRMSGMNQQTLLELDPQQIRARVAVYGGFEIDPKSTQLSLDIADEAGRRESRSYALNLLSKTNGRRPGGMFHSDYPVVAYEFALNSESVEDLRRLQKAFAHSKNPGLDLNVQTTAPGYYKAVRFWIDLQLKESEPYMTIVDGAELKPTKVDD